MATMEFRPEPSRDQLSQIILECLQSWPELHRRIFVEIHYCGRSAEHVARTLSLPPAEVAHVLEQCDRKLHDALKAFRNGVIPTMSEVQLPEYSASCHSH